MLINIIIPVLF